MPRLFVAVVPPAEVVEDLELLLEPRREHGGLRWTDPDQLHLTLAFLPAVPEARVERVLEALADSAGRHPLGRLQLRGAGAFPAPERARVLWMGVAGDVDGLASLATSLRASASAAGGAPEGGPFRPHLTVARTRPLEATRWLRVLGGYAGPAWTPASVVVIQSHLGQGRDRRPRYELLAELPLGSAVAG